MTNILKGLPFRHFLGSTWRQILVTCLNFVTTILIARVLGPAESGRLAAFLVAPSLIALIFSAGMGVSVTHYLAKGEISLREVLDVFDSLCVRFGIILLPILLCIEKFFGAKWGYVAILIAGVMTLSGFVRLLYSGLLLGQRNYRLFDRVSWVSALIKPMVLIGAKYLGFNFSFVFALGVMASEELFAAVTLLSFFQGDRKSSPTNVSRTVPELLKVLLNYGWKSNLNNVILAFVYRADVYFIEYFSGLSAVGVYSFAVQVAEKAWLPSQALSTIIFPELSATRDFVVRRHLLHKSLIFIGLVTILLGLSIPLITYLLVVFAGKGFAGSVVLAEVLAPGIVLMALSRVLWNYIAACGYPDYNTWVILICFAANMVLNFVLIPRFGALGAAISTSVSYLIHLLASWRKAVLIHES